MKKAILSVFLLGTFGTYAFSNQPVLIAQNLTATPTASTDPVPSIEIPNPITTPTKRVTTTPVKNPVQIVTKPVSTPKSTLTPNSTVVPAPAPEITPAPITKGQYNDGAYTGTEADAVYGIIQVKAIVSGGKLTDVQFLQYPSDRRTSQQINSEAMPYLKTEALQAQSAKVDIVSGASDTSAAFVESLGAALSQARV